jgi:hypothetical protein
MLTHLLHGAFSAKQFQNLQPGRTARSAIRIVTRRDLGDGGFGFCSPLVAHFYADRDRHSFAASREGPYVACRLVAIGSLSANRPYTSFS